MADTILAPAADTPKATTSRSRRRDASRSSRHRRPAPPSYRPRAAAPTRTATSGAAVTATVARTSPQPLPASAVCERCEATRRFERRVGALVRRILVLGACAALAAWAGAAQPTTARDDEPAHPVTGTTVVAPAAPPTADGDTCGGVAFWARLDCIGSGPGAPDGH